MHFHFDSEAMKAKAQLLACIVACCVVMQPVKADCGSCCASQVDCQSAFRGSPGQCCGRAKNKPYCCPDTGVCVSSGSAWACEGGSGGGYNGPAHQHHYFANFLLLVILLPILGCCCLVVLAYGIMRNYCGGNLMGGAGPGRVFAADGGV